MFIKYIYNIFNNIILKINIYIENIYDLPLPRRM